jgi:methylthioxylose transferase
VDGLAARTVPTPMQAPARPSPPRPAALRRARPSGPGGALFGSAPLAALRRAWRRAPGADAALALAVWAGLITVSRTLVERLYDRGVNPHVGNAPLVGALDPRLSWRLAPAVALGALAVAFAPALAARLPWRGLLAAAGLASVAWAVALASSDGIGAVAAPLLEPYDYLGEVQRAGDPLFLVSTFGERAGQFATHPGSHPPGLLALLSALREVGVHGEWVLAGLIFAGAALAAPSALVALRELAGEPRARAAAPFVALAPCALWVATSADALFMGVAAAGIAMMVLATGRTGTRGDALAAGGGAVLGLALQLSYGSAPLGLVVVAVAAGRRRVRPLLVGGAALAAVFALFALAGFWWPDGLQQARGFYAGGVSRLRPYGTFLLVDLTAFAIALGPATAVALTRLRDRGTSLLAGGALLAIAAADLSGLSKGETERIWLPFAPWLLLACAALAADRAARGWLALQLMVALVLQAAITSPW